MTEFERVVGPHGIPIFYERLPSVIKCTGISLTVLVGAADDTSCGEPGLYHWFEHAPFRGTVNFPNGYTDTKGTIARFGGESGANTSALRTNFWATIPDKFLPTAVRLVTDLVARPLLTDEGIVAERDIIGQEIKRALGSLERCHSYNLWESLFPEHVLGNRTLGTTSSLDSMTPDVLRNAWMKGYDRSRMIFVVSTSLERDEVMQVLSEPLASLPSNSLTPRRSSPSYGELTWPKEKRFVAQSSFEPSQVSVVFPIPALKSWTDLVRYGLLGQIFTFGGLGSPLYRAVRENKQLAYTASQERFHSLDGGFIGFEVNTSSEKIPAVENALLEMLRSDPQIRSREWWATVRAGMRNNLDMQIPSPTRSVAVAISEIVLAGETIAAEMYLNYVDTIPHEELTNLVDQMTPQRARTVITLGK